MEISLYLSGKENSRQVSREKKNPEWFQEERVLLAEAEYVSPGEEILDRRRAPECFLGDRKSFLLFCVEMPSLESEACQSCMKTEVESNRSLLSVSTPQTLGRVVGSAWV